MLGFTALAVDGSMVYADRRFAQNAADAAALAGGAAAAMEIERLNPGLNANNWPCTASNITSGVIPSSLNTVASKGKVAASTSANENGFVLATNEARSTVLANKHGVYLICGKEGSDKFLEVHALVTRQTNTSFVHFVFGGPMVNSVEAVVRVRPRQSLAYGYTIVTLNPAACSGNKYGMQVRGNSTLTVDGGGVWNNGCLDQDGGAGEVNINGGGVAYCHGNGSYGNFNVTPVQTGNPCEQIPPETYTLEFPPDCTHASAHNVTASQFETQANSTAGLSAGLWCISGSVKFNAHDEPHGDDVTIVFKNGGMTINGGATVNFVAPRSSSFTPAIQGLLIYAPQSNASKIQINGGSGSHFVGTILTSGAHIDLTGNARDWGIPDPGDHLEPGHWRHE